MSHRAPESVPFPSVEPGGEGAAAEREPGWGRAGWAARLQPAPLLLLAFRFVAVPGNALHISFPVFPLQPKAGSYWPSLSPLSPPVCTPHPSNAYAGQNFTV